MEICLSRINHPGMGYAMFDLLKDTVQHKGCSYSRPDRINYSAVKAEWQQLLETHRDRIRSGRLFQIAEPPLTVAMFPAGFKFTRRGQADWPN